MRKRVTPAVLIAVFLCTSGLARASESASKDRVFDSCADSNRTLLATWGRDGQHASEVPIWRAQDGNAFFFVSSLLIDADGAPNAYNPDDTGLDELANAGSPKNWNGIVTDSRGNPLIQQEGDPFPGYYVSCTSLTEKNKQLSDPARYVDATKIPYIALPEVIAERGGAKLGDFAFVVNLRNGKSSFAIYADIGTLGEGSVALAESLGISSNARRGGESDGVLYVVFPSSGNMNPRSTDEIQGKGERLLSDSGGVDKLFSCGRRDDIAVSSGEF